MQGVSRPLPKPADRLHDLRKQISALKAAEESLRQGFISGALDPIGDQYTVTVETRTNQRINLAEMRQHVAGEIWTPYLVEKVTSYVCVRKRAGDG
ncbi:hypothetical protein AC629_02345 [Bradyrhizobium sp. NAS80.1]|uniref:hypothetical protein n=1 Tax=Bradyrhizobium sp. NAS80.1 TaxID=1680159 RepID=UPI00096070C1|nr:hypothetical protein [Bradyrhizobium sp. NAS80.1]OKO91558.1 hypothetical protein AC629_02345 [Bradyrhizobium sp. NAS80.1]